MRRTLALLWWPSMRLMVRNLRQNAIKIRIDCDANQEICGLRDNIKPGVVPLFLDR